ncbi:MAG: PDZ domain-containing protein [Myxococcota bacterium]
MAPTPLARLALALVVCIAVVAPSAAEPSAKPPGLHDLLFGRGRIGIRVQPLTPELREHFGVPADRGVLVSQVETGRPAEKGGLRVGDVIVAMDGEAVSAPGQLAGRIRRLPDGAEIKLTVVRKGEEIALELQPDAPKPLLDDEAEEWAERFGRHLEEGGRHLERRLRELEGRLEDLQRDIEQRLRELEGRDQRT